MRHLQSGYGRSLWDSACFDPASPTLAAIAIGASVLSAGVGAYGVIQQGNANAAAANYQGQVAANNATIAEQNARTATAAGEAQVEQSRMKTKALIGTIEAAQASSGIDTGSGSPLDIRTSQKQVGELDAETIRNNAARQAYGYRSQSTSFAADQGLDASRAASASQAGTIGAVGSILGGASSAGTKYIDFLKVNAPKGVSVAT